MATANLTAARLRELFSYDPAIGLLVRKINCSHEKVGSCAGSLGPQGYRHVQVDGLRRPAHRLIWLYVYGEFPAGEVDHIDGDRSNNRLSNLRAVTRAVNAQNQRSAKRTNTSGLLGVSPAPRGSIKRWMAQITVGGKKRYLGTFSTPEDAHEAYVAEKRRSHEGCAI